MSKRIIVTGASGGVGLSTCQLLVEKGHRVAGAMRSTGGKNEAVAETLRGIGVELIELDVTDQGSVDTGIEQAIEALGGLDVVFNNAGVLTFGLQETLRAEEMHQVFDVNVFGVQRVMRAVLPHFRAQRSGLVLYTSSLIGRVAINFYATYCASKWALEALADAYRAELSGFGIESCIVEPGPMPTAFIGGNMLRPTDVEAGRAYGPLAEALEPSLAGLEAAMESNPRQRPRMVAEAVAELLEMPFGRKPFRTTVDHMGLGDQIAPYNAQLHQVTHAIYSAFGNQGLLELNAEPGDSATAAG
ncbi:MAG: SDR family oxidoreductase [Myxococcota bacterium]